jgi:hypothetical protein
MEAKLEKTLEEINKFLDVSDYKKIDKVNL